MAGKPVHEFSDDQILDAVKASGSIVAAAATFGVARNTLDSIVGKRGLRERCAELRQQKAVQAREPKDPDPLAEVSEVEMLRQENREMRERLRKSRKKDIVDERLLQAVESAVTEREARYSPLAIPKSHRSQSKHEFVLLWSDQHAGETVSLEETNGIASYDWDTMMQRHDKIRESILSYQDNRPYPVETLHIFGLGDVVGGNIHEELQETNEFPIAETTIQAGLDFGAWLETLVPRFKRIKFAGVRGNHGRLTKKPKAKHGWDGFDWLMYHTMRLSLRGYPSVEFAIPKADMWPVLVAERWRCLLFHGDGVRSSMPGVPWGGVTRRASALQDSYTAQGLPIDLFCCGHFHTANVVECSAGRVAMNGSVKGIDEYSLRAYGAGRKAQQLLLTFHPRNGLTDVSLIDLEDPRAGA